MKSWLLLCLAALMFPLAGCGRPSGTALDDVLYPKKACSQDMTLDNQGREPLRMAISMGESTHDAACDAPQAAEGFKIVSAGAKDSLHVELMCRQCMLHKFYAVTKVDAKSTVLYNESMGSADVFCSDTSCLGR